MEKADQSHLFDTDKISDIVVIETMEDMDLYSAIQIKEHYNSLCNAGKKLFIIDLKNTRYLDSSGLGVLIHIHTTAVKDKSIIVRFINIADTVFKVLKLTHLDNMFWIASDIDTAVKEIQIQQTGKETGAKVQEKITGDNEEELSHPQINETRLNAIKEHSDKENHKSDTERSDDKEPALIMDVEQLSEDEDLEEEIIKNDEKKKTQAEFITPVQNETKIDIKQIKINGDSPLFQCSGLKLKTFHITTGKIRNAIDFIIQNTYLDPDELEQLEHQLYEILKNAVKHGNKGKWWKEVKVWYSINSDEARFIIEDKGKGFRQIEEWNELFRQRAICYLNKDRESLKKYRSFRTAASDTSDRGTALFSAIEYWNGGIVFNEKRNSVAVKVIFR